MKPLARLWFFFFRPCNHEWRSLYGDEIVYRMCRSVCVKCGNRSKLLRGETE